MSSHMSHAAAPGLLTHGHPGNPWSSTRFIYVLSPDRFVPEHPNSSGKGEEKVVFPGTDRNGGRTPQAGTVSTEFLITRQQGHTGPVSGPWEGAGRREARAGFVLMVMQRSLPDVLCKGTPHSWGQDLQEHPLLCAFFYPSKRLPR